MLNVNKPFKIIHIGFTKTLEAIPFHTLPLQAYTLILKILLKANNVNYIKFTRL